MEPFLSFNELGNRVCHFSRLIALAPQNRRKEKRDFPHRIVSGIYQWSRAIEGIAERLFGPRPRESKVL